MKPTIGSVSFGEDGSVLITYMTMPTDVRNRGLLIGSHQIQISPGEAGKDYGDEIEDVRDAAGRLLADALEDFGNTEPFEPGSTDD